MIGVILITAIIFPYRTKNKRDVASMEDAAYCITVFVLVM